MTLPNANPSIDPTNNDSLPGSFRFILGKFLQGIDDMLPARVIAFDREANRAQVFPLIALLTTDGRRISRAQIASVPVMQIGGGGFILNFNLKPGDLGWIKANDRDISLFLQQYAEEIPNTQRKHNFSDAVFIPDVMTGFTIAGEDAENTVLQTLDGSVRISLWRDKVKVTAPQLTIGDTENYGVNTSAILDLSSTTKALLIPRMTTGERDAIASPEGGMMVYCTDLPGFSSYTDGSGWS